MKALIYIVMSCAFAFQSYAQDGKSGFTNITSDTLHKVMKESHTVLLDVRTPEEYKEGHIPGAINVNYLDEKFENGVDTLNKNLVYQVYCLSGGRSALASEIMVKKGFKNVFNLEGGITDWKKKGLPVTK